MNVDNATLFQLVVFFSTYMLHTGLYCYLSDKITSTVAMIDLFFDFVLSTFTFSTKKNFCFHIFPNRLWPSQYELLSDKAYASNFLTFDLGSKKALVLLMSIASNRPMKIEPALFVRFELTLEMFLKVNTWNS